MRMIGIIFLSVFATCAAFGPAEANDEVSAPPTPPDPVRNWEKRHAARLIVKFEGGVHSELLADTWFKLIAAGVDEGERFSAKIGTKTYTMQESDMDLCVVLEREIELPTRFCSDRLVNYIRYFSKLNGGTAADLASVKPGTQFVLPDLEVSKYLVLRTFDLSNPQERIAAQRITNNPEWRKVIRSEHTEAPSPTGWPAEASKGPLGTEGVHTIEIEGLKWILPIDDADDIPQFAAMASLLNDGPNRSASIQRAAQYQTRRPRKFAGITPKLYYQNCVNGVKPDTRADYASFLPSEYKVPLECSVPAGSSRPEVVIIDNRVAYHPDLLHSLKKAREDYVFYYENYLDHDANVEPTALPEPSSTPPTKPACGDRMQFDQRQHHATYLASIVASKGVWNGFGGIYPDTDIRHIYYDGNDQSTDEVSTMLTRVLREPKTPRVALFASEFQTRDPPAPDAALSDAQREEADTLFAKKGREWIDELQRPEVREQYHALNRYFKGANILFVVAAGQQTTPLALRKQTLWSPQNMGDHKNVLVVTACTDCDSKSAEVWDKANYSETDQQLVHLAAPGGTPIPGIVTDKHVGEAEAGGTSAAAAFVSGVAASMLACHPGAYAQTPKRLKEWLLITARPNMSPKSQSKAPAGTLDPSLALVDPMSSWLKPVGDGLPLEKVEVTSWCAETIPLNKDGVKIGRMELSDTRRIVRLENGKLIGKEFATERDDSTFTRNFSLRGPGVAKTMRLANIKRADGNECALALDNVKDLLLHEFVSDTSCKKELSWCFE